MVAETQAQGAAGAWPRRVDVEQASGHGSKQPDGEQWLIWVIIGLGIVAIALSFWR